MTSVVVDTSLENVNNIEYEQELVLPVDQTSTSSCRETYLPKEMDRRKHKKYRELVNRSKQKLINSAIRDENKFKANTRSQKRRIGLLTDKYKIAAVGYKLMDIKLLHNVLGKSCICKVL